MMLVQRPNNFQLNPLASSSSFHHRRHPSAPPAVVVVQPTRTPGLLSLSKPRQQQPQQRSPKPAPAQRSTPKLQLNVGPTPTTPSPAPRGRQAKDKADATPRSTSLSTRRPTHRQASPPSQAEGPPTPIKSSNFNYDPFLVSPTLSTRPSGKLAHRRQKPSQSPQQQPPSQPVSIPSKNKQQPQVSRSVPLPPHRPAKHTFNPTVSTTTFNPRPLPAFDFPICDDMTDAGDLSDVEPALASPVTPTRPPRTFHKSMSASKVPFSSPPINFKQGTGRPRNHKRAPSDSGMVFNMSSDESGTESSGSEELRALLRSMGASRHASAPRTPAKGSAADREKMYEEMAKKEVHGYFASSAFQNSPSPEELPDPLFV